MYEKNESHWKWSINQSEMSIQIDIRSYSLMKGRKRWKVIRKMRKQQLERRQLSSREKEDRELRK